MEGMHLAACWLTYKSEMDEQSEGKTDKSKVQCTSWL